MCRLHKTSKGLKQESKILVARLDEPQRKRICDLTPFEAKKALDAFLIKGPSWLVIEFIGPVQNKRSLIDNAKGSVIMGTSAKEVDETEREIRLVKLHASAATLAKEIRKKEAKIRKAPGDLEEKIAMLRRTEAEKMDTMMFDLERTKRKLAFRTVQLESVCSIKE